MRQVRTHPAFADGDLADVLAVAGLLVAGRTRRQHLVRRRVARRSSQPPA